MSLVAQTVSFGEPFGYYASDNELRLQHAEPLVKRALAIDDRDVVALKANAALLRAQGKFEDAIVAAHLLIEQNPGEPWAYKEVALSTMYLGRVADFRCLVRKSREDRSTRPRTLDLAWRKGPGAASARAGCGGDQIFTRRCGGEPCKRWRLRCSRGSLRINQVRTTKHGLRLPNTGALVPKPLLKVSDTCRRCRCG
jgi:hypothetical protein